MAFLKTLAVNFGRITTLVQVILYLPLTLDVAGQDAFLALSAALACYYAILSTIRLLTRRTRLRWVGEFLAIWQFLVIPVCLLLVFNVYSPPKDSYFAVVRRAAASATAAGSDVLEDGRNAFQAARTLRGSQSSTATATGVATGIWRAKDRLGTAGSSRSSSDPNPLETPPSPGFSAPQQLGSIVSFLLQYAINVTFFLARHVPPWWHTFLRWSSPAFSLLEGVATLLVIQVLGSLSRWCIASALSRPPMAPTPKSRPLYYFRSVLRYVTFGLTSAEALQVFFLLASALTYCTSAVALYASFDGATRDRPGTAAAIGAAVSSTLWLTGIAFALRKGNVVETSLMFAYVTWNVYQLSDSLNFTADPLALIRSFQQASSARGLATETLLLPLHLPPWVLEILGPLMEVVRHFLRQTASFIGAAGATLPKSVIVSLIYRLMVLYLASRILPLLKSGNGPQEWRTEAPARSHVHSGSQTEWKGRSSASQTEEEESESESESEEGSESGEAWSGTESGTESVTEGEEGNGGAYGMAMGGKGKGTARTSSARHQATEATAGRRRALPKRKEDDEPFGAFVQFIVAYSRLTLIAVYSHLLLLDQSNAITWRFLTVSITIGVWFCEIALGTDDGGEAWR